MMRLLRVVFVLVVAFAFVPSARGDNKEKARDAFRAASQHYDLGEYTDALASFKEAYRNFEDPAFLFNIAQCHRQLGDNQQAVREYRMYLLKVPDASNAIEVRELITKLERAIAEEQANKVSPPQGTAAPAAASVARVSSTNADVARPVARASAPRPLYKRWWLWTSVGAVAVIGVALGVGLAAAGRNPTATTTFGTVGF